MSGACMDVNADLGEGSPGDEDLLDTVTSASIACGFHAGGPTIMLARARAAAARRVVVGAHPSYPDREGFGRRHMDIPDDDLFSAIVYQVGAMSAAARVTGGTLRFVKPHGALYNRAAADPGVAEVVIAAVAACGLALLGPAGSQMQYRAESAGVAWFAEVFADRAYMPDGSLADRSQRGAVLDDAGMVGRRAVELARWGRVVATDGSVLELPAQSICVHGDTPGALALARSVRHSLEEAGITVAPLLPA